MQELKSHLDHVAGPDSPKTKVAYTSGRVLPPSRFFALTHCTPQRFFKKLTATRQIYQRLADLLDGYAHGVETSLAA